MLISLVLLPASPEASLREKVEELARELLTAMSSDRRLTVAVTEFPDLQGVTSDLSRYVAERLTTTLSQSQRVGVVERRRLAQVLAELGWSQAELLDPAKTARIGQMAGVDAILVGSLADLGPSLEVEARLVALESGQVLAVSTVALPKDQSVTALLEQGRQLLTPPVGGRPTGPTALESSGGGGLAEEPQLPEHWSKVGARWRYAVRVERQEGLFIKRKVTQQGEWVVAHEGEVPFAGGAAMRLRGQYRLGNAGREESFYYRLGERAVEQLGEEHLRPGSQRILLTYEPPIVLWRAGAKLGDQWETAYKPALQGPQGSRAPGAGAPGRTTIRLDAALATLLGELLGGSGASREKRTVVKVVVGPMERISVPLGEFDGQRVEYQRGALAIVDWYVAAIGLAKRTMTGPQGRMEADLVEFARP